MKTQDYQYVEVQKWIRDNANGGYNTLGFGYCDCNRESAHSKKHPNTLEFCSGDGKLVARGLQVGTLRRDSALTFSHYDKVARKIRHSDHAKFFLPYHGAVTIVNGEDWVVYLLIHADAEFPDLDNVKHIIRNGDNMEFSVMSEKLSIAVLIEFLYFELVYDTDDAMISPFGISHFDEFSIVLEPKSDNLNSYIDEYGDLELYPGYDLQMLIFYIIRNDRKNVIKLTQTYITNDKLEILYDVLVMHADLIPHKNRTYYWLMYIFCSRLDSLEA